MEIDLTSYYRMIVKRLWIIILCIVLFTVPTASLTDDTYEPIYQASTDLYLTHTSNQSQQVDYNSIRIIFDTSMMMEKVLQWYPDLQLNAEQLSRAVSISEISGSRVLRINAQDSSYESAVKVANNVAHVFQVEMPQWIDVESIMVLSPAQSADNPQPINPKSNRQIQLVVASFIASIVVSIGIILLLEILDDTVKTAKDIREIFNKPTWAVVPKMRKKHYKSKKVVIREGMYASKNE